MWRPVVLLLPTRWVQRQPKGWCSVALFPKEYGRTNLIVIQWCNASALILALAACCGFPIKNKILKTQNGFRSTAATTGILPRQDRWGCVNFNHGLRSWTTPINKIHQQPYPTSCSSSSVYVNESEGWD